ncbi:MAG: M36 family metallopeptidase [Saprospiraceae bacterium]|nr:M36 family metallopeptidase [Saprospiraceae bacterium]
MKKSIFYLFIFSSLINNLDIQAQSVSTDDAGRKYIQAAVEQWGLSSADVKDLLISDQYTSEHNGVTHIYYQQAYQGIPVYNAITSVHITRDGKVYDSPHRFVPNLASKINSTKARISALKAMENMLLHYQVKNAILPSDVYRTEANKRIYSKTNFSHSDIPVRLVYAMDKAGNLKLAWDISMDLTDRTDYWSTRIDAITGQIIDEHNYTLYCQFGHQHKGRCTEEVHASGLGTEKIESQHQPVDLSFAASAYNVIPVPIESPIHGSRQLVTDPEYKNASPFGWHDTNGQAGAEFTITRGNNVNAYLDRNADNAADPERADGGASLIFDFPFDQKLNPASYTKAAMTNLFYMNNMMHDVLYQFGFTEPAGNFQSNNYGKGGAATDHVLAEAQDGSGVNNANFSTPSDGNSGRMQMYLWSGAAGDVSIDAPDSIAGPAPMTPGSGWGGAATTTPLIGEVVWSDDGVPGKERLGCRNTQKREKLQGKIVVITRGECEFGDKALYAQNAGAIAVIICGFDEQNVSMGAGARGAQVTIPTYFARKSICDRFIAYIENGLIIRIVRPTGGNAGPDSLDGDFDNGIIAHEYGHGVSNRLTGGPAQAGCLGNAEQMGEGWSDFMSLLMTQRAGDNRDMVKGIGNYASNAPTDGIGIRRKPYATNMAINSHTYKNINSSVHDLGEVWAVMLWDLYWALSDKYGYDPNFLNKSAGNNIAIQLVMDGMKLQPCGPGIVDGRNAILKADTINNGAANSCLIWEVFARRGVGFNASQGLANLVGDEREDYEAFPTCINKTLINKSAPFVIKAGEEFTVSITIRNLRASSVRDLRLDDLIPDGCTYVNGSASLTPNAISGDKLNWIIDSMRSLQNLVITYKLKSAVDRFSNTLFIDDFEHPDTEFKYEWADIPGSIGTGSFQWIGGLGVDESTAWWWETSGSEARRHYLFKIDPIKLPDVDCSVLFYHKLNTLQGLDGGFIDVSTDGFIYERIESDDFFLNGYQGDLSYNTFPIPFLKGFSGYLRDYTPVVFDISKYKGKDFKIRFNAGNDDSGESTQPGQKGWLIDNFEVITPYFYNSDLCMTTGLGENHCVNFGKKGILVDSKKVVNTSDDRNEVGEIKVFPNPGRDRIFVQHKQAKSNFVIHLRNLQGQILQTKNGTNNAEILSFEVGDLPRGVMILEVIEAGKVQTQKIILK